MSLLMSTQLEDRAIIITDTLVVDSNNLPHSHRSKVWTLPHMNMVFAMTGTPEVGDFWYNHIVNHAGARDIKELNTVAPQSLRDIQTLVERRYGDAGHSTIQHFGFHRGSDRLVRYAYRSKNDYEPEIFSGDRFNVKPAPPGFTLEVPGTLDEMVDLAVRLRDVNRNDPDGAPIGGDIFATSISNWNIHTARLGEFPDDDSWDAIRSNRTTEGETNV